MQGVYETEAAKFYVKEVQILLPLPLPLPFPDF